MQAEAGEPSHAFQPVALNPALSRSPDHHTFLLVALGFSGKPALHVSYAGRAEGDQGLPSHAFDPVALKSPP